MKTPDSILVRPARGLRGTLRLPGDKSISHRYAMLGAIAEGITRLGNYATGADCASTLRCLRRLGARIEETDGTLNIHGGALKSPADELDCGNSGSTMRMLSGILAAQPFASTLTGDASLSRRPMRRITEPLTRMGAAIQTNAEGTAPVRIQPAGQGLSGIEFQSPVASAQVKTCLLFAGLHASGETTIHEPVASRDHGELALQAFGGEVHRGRGWVRVAGGQRLRAVSATIPGDISTASFFLCGAAILPDSELVLEHVLLNPTRSAILDVLGRMGARLRVTAIEDSFGELTGVLKTEPGDLRGATISGPLSAQLIDELPVLAAIAPYTREGLEIRDAGELRVKESDRIAAVAANLRRMGADVTELEDGLRIPGGQSLHGAELDAAGDHRIAMAFAIAALRATGDSLIHGAEAASVSFPQFWTMLEACARR